MVPVESVVCKDGSPSTTSLTATFPAPSEPLYRGMATQSSNITTKTSARGSDLPWANHFPGKREFLSVSFFPRRLVTALTLTRFTGAPSFLFASIPGVDRDQHPCSGMFS